MKIIIILFLYCLFFNFLKIDLLIILLIIIKYNMYKIFTSIDNFHIIGITLCDDIAYFKIILFEFENVKTFLLLFKECIEYLNNNNIKIIKQEIVNEDIELFKNSKIINKTSEEHTMIETNFINFIDEIYNVLNINISSLK
jgi:hypothetical protein